MNRSQRILLSIYIPSTILILIFDRIYPYSEIVQYIKYLLVVTLGLSTAVVKKSTREQKIMALSFLFVIIADFFLVFLTTIDGLSKRLPSFGIFGFMMAYICLIVAYQKNFKIRREELLLAVPVILISARLYSGLLPEVRGIEVPIVIIFGLVLSFMVWTAVSTIFRKYFSKKVSYIIAISGILMYICDVGVAYSALHPHYSGTYVPWLKNMIWASYIPGWTLLALVINEENPKL